MMRDAAREYDRVMVTVSKRDDLMHVMENKGGFAPSKRGIPVGRTWSFLA